MTILFTGPNKDKSLNEFTIQIPNHAEKIRNQGLQVLKGLEKQSQLQQNRSKEILQALKEKAHIESDYRRKAYEFEKEDNLRVAKDFDRNATVNIKNIRTKADNEARKYKALADIVGASGQFITAAADITAKRQEKKDTETAERLNIQTVEQILERPRPKTEPPKPPQPNSSDKELDEWVKEYDKWRSKNDHLPNLQPGSTIVQRFKQRGAPGQVQGQASQVPSGITPDQNARIQRLEQKMDKLMKHLGVK